MLSESGQDVIASVKFVSGKWSLVVRKSNINLFNLSSCSFRSSNHIHLGTMAVENLFCGCLDIVVVYIVVY